ncbi:MAG: hypothetical protein U1E29_05250, partial [Coriobacteriia bacterium]|nr:hypothetical protein [Coriobacteriia bacterium]
PILVTKSTNVPDFYSLRAISVVEGVLVRDESLNVLHAYIQLYMMRRGRVRSTLGIVGERLAFRSFEQTLAAYVGHVLSEPDSTLASYRALEDGALAEFEQRFADDPVTAVTDLFGTPELERREELAEIVDLRLAGLEQDIEESDVSDEIDETVGTAPGAGIELTGVIESDPLVDYMLDYTAVHLSKVLARALRAYVERGLAAMSTELRVTRAPRKTLNAVARLAAARFAKTAIIYDGFDNWQAIDREMRQTIVGTLSEMRWTLDGLAAFIFLLEDGRVPELEEQFGAGTRLSWEFGGLVALQQEPDLLETGMVESWLAAASLVGAESLTLGDPILAGCFAEADGSLMRFVTGAAAAIESAAERGVEILDEAAAEAARNAVVEVVDSDA